jgi:branched-chain amino acid transport system substrate-binding protein
MKLSKCFFILLAILIGFAVAADATEKIFKIGVCAGYTGANATWGDNTKAATEEAFSEIGNKIGDYKIELVWVDTQSDPAKGTAALAEAIERKGIDIVFYNVLSEVAVAMIDVAAQYKIPYFCGLGATELINEKYQSNPEKYKYYGGKGWPSASKLVGGYVDAINDAYNTGLWKPKNRKVVVYGADNGWGRSIGKALKKMLTDTGWEVVMEEYLAANQVDHYPLIDKIKRADSSLLVGTLNIPPLMFSFVKQLGEMEYDGLVVAEALSWAGNWYEMTGAASNYLLDMSPQLASKEAVAWADRMDKKYGFRPSAAAGALPYDYARFLIKSLKRALEKHGKLDRAAYLDVMLSEVTTGKLTYTMDEGAILMKEYKYTKESMPDPVVSPNHFAFPVVQYMDGKPIIIYPPHLKQADLKIKK